MEEIPLLKNIFSGVDQAEAIQWLDKIDSLYDILGKMEIFGYSKENLSDFKEIFSEISQFAKSNKVKFSPQEFRNLYSIFNKSILLLGRSPKDASKKAEQKTFQILLNPSLYHAWEEPDLTRKMPIIGLYKVDNGKIAEDARFLYKDISDIINEIIAIFNQNIELANEQNLKQISFDKEDLVIAARISNDAVKNGYVSQVDYEDLLSIIDDVTIRAGEISGSSGKESGRFLTQSEKDAAFNVQNGMHDNEYLDSEERKSWKVLLSKDNVKIDEYLKKFGTSSSEIEQIFHSMTKFINFVLGLKSEYSKNSEIFSKLSKFPSSISECIRDIIVGILYDDKTDINASFTNNNSVWELMSDFKNTQSIRDYAPNPTVDPQSFENLYNKTKEIINQLFAKKRNNLQQYPKQFFVAFQNIVEIIKNSRNRLFMLKNVDNMEEDSFYSIIKYFAGLEENLKGLSMWIGRSLQKAKTYNIVQHDDPVLQKYQEAINGFLYILDNLFIYQSTVRDMYVTEEKKVEFFNQEAEETIDIIDNAVSDNDFQQFHPLFLEAKQSILSMMSRPLQQKDTRFSELIDLLGTKKNSIIPMLKNYNEALTTNIGRRQRIQTGIDEDEKLG
ncbi:MAG: hypothetical protein Q7R95_03435, partial [bacterium]|nr:hypothetical protein [bacterium]